VHNTDSFIDEVSEAVRRDRVARTLRRYGWLIAALVVLVVGAAALNEWHKVRTARQAAAAGDEMRAALAQADAKARADALAAFAAATPDAAVAARLAEAGALARSGDTAGAGAALAAIADDGGVPALYRSLASLERVMIAGATLDASERDATLETLAQPDAPFRPLALEQRALVRLGNGDKEGAIADLQAILAEPTATEALAGRARQLIIAAGGSLPALPGAGPAATGPGTVDGVAAPDPADG
jgi:hypothetical protein